MRLGDLEMEIFQRKIIWLYDFLLVAAKAKKSAANEIQILNNY